MIRSPVLSLGPPLSDISLDPNADDQQILAQIVNFYQSALKADSDALAYLKGRGIMNPAVLDHFRIGFADRSLGTKLPSNETKAGRLIRSRLQGIGLFRDSGHEHFAGCVTFPIQAADGSGQIVDIYGRKTLGQRLRKGTALDLPLNDKNAGVFNIAGFGGRHEIVLCSSLWDALTFWHHGYRNVTCTFTDDVTSDLLAAFKEFAVKRVLTTSEKLVEKLLGVGLETFVVRLPLGISVSEYASQTEDPAEALGSILRAAEWMGNGNVPAVVSSRPTTTQTPPIPDPDDDEPPDDELDVEGEDEEVSEESKPPVFGTNILPSLTEGRGVGGAGDDDGVGGFVVQPHPDPDLLPSLPPIREASPLPAPSPVIEAEVGADEVTITFGTRRYRVRGFNKNLAFDVMKVNVLASNDHGMFVDTFDLYAAKHRRSFVVQTAAELGVEESTVKNDVGRVLLKLEELQDLRLREVEKTPTANPEMTSQERDEAIALLRDPKLLDRIVGDFRVVGERTNKLVGYLAAVSRKLDHPLAVLIQSTSAAGKTTLMEAVLSFVPSEDVVKFSAMTGQALFYMSEGNLKHRILAIVEEEGATKAGYALKLLQSEGELRIASTGKEGTTGRLTTQEYRVEGPTMLFLTTTSITTDEELLNRCIVLTVDEDREQTRAIHVLQRRRETLEGMLAAQAHNNVLALHRNAQRLLRPLLVVNPFAEKLTFLDARTRTRRDHQKYLTLIRSVTLLHQHQRPVRTVEHEGKTIEFIEVTLEDIERTNELAGEVLGRSLDDLPPQTRTLLVLLDGLVKSVSEKEAIEMSEVRLSRRQIREQTGWGDTQLKIHLKRLLDLEYVLVHRDGEGKRHLYELLYTASGENRVMPGLIDVSVLRGSETPVFDADRSGVAGHRSGSGRGAVGPRSGQGRGGKTTPSPEESRAKPRSGGKTLKIVPTPSKNGTASDKV
ncbi:MAG: DNA primase [Planctomycetes bacterium]|nr:DNA primase [Planctomycetota bacterium]